MSANQSFGRVLKLLSSARRFRVKALNALNGLGTLGVSTGLKAVAYSIEREQIQWRYRKVALPEYLELFKWNEPSRTPGRLLRVDTNPAQVAYLKVKNSSTRPSGTVSAAVFHFMDAVLEIRFFSPELFVATWKPGIPSPPYGLDNSFRWPSAEIEIQDSNGWWSLSTAKLTVKVSPLGEVQILDDKGVVVRKELPPTRRGDHWTTDSICQPDDHICGLGEQASGLDLKGGKYTLFNRDPGGVYGPGQDPLYLGIPMYMVFGKNYNYLIFHENPYRSRFHFRYSKIRASFSAGELRTWFCIGSSATDLMSRWTDLTGKPPLPPRWALGYHFSRWGYKNQDELVEVAKQFHDRKIPVAAMHLDLDYMDNFKLFTFSPTQFPNPSQMCNSLEKLGTKIVTIVDCGVKCDNQYPLYIEGIKNNYFCLLPNQQVATGVVWPGLCAFPDFSNPEVRKWWQTHYKILLLAGVAGIWHDMNEPTTLEIAGDRTLPDATSHSLEGQGGNHAQVHNLYGLVLNQTGYQALKNHRPNRRPWILSRSGWAGVQRYAWVWTGDTDSSWEALAQTIPTVLGMGLSAIAFAGSDIGGFSGSPSPELYTRWLSMAVFMGFCRTHSIMGTKHREPWLFEEPWRSAIVKFIRLRAYLLPYLYTIAASACQTGLPVNRPLFWDCPACDELWVSDSFMLGDELLVAPILQQGVTSRLVRLPTGSWYVMSNDVLIDNLGATPKVVGINFGIEDAPVLVRSGTILPCEQVGALGGSLHNNSLILHIWPDPKTDKAKGDLYSDALDGYGPARLDSFTLEPGSDRDTKKDTPEKGILGVRCWKLTRKTKFIPSAAGNTKTSAKSSFAFPWSDIKVVIHGEKASTPIVVDDTELTYHQVKQSDMDFQL